MGASTPRGGYPQHEYLIHPSTEHLELPGWKAVEHAHDMAVWRDADGDFLGLTKAQGSLGLPRLGDDEALREHCRTIAEGMDGALLEVEVVEHVQGPAVLFVCRRPHEPGFVFTGVLMLSTPQASWVWSVSAQELKAAGAPGADVTELPGARVAPLEKVRAELRKLLCVSLTA